jgi:DNA primase
MSQVDDIKQRIDLVDFIQGYVKLTQAGTNWKARCPFHSEKTPSFMASREKQIWHCFGCGRGGDVFSFLQEAEGVEFPEALRILAERAGVELTRDDPKTRTARTRAFDVNALAAKVFHTILLEHEKAKPARDYLAQRGITDETIRDWLIGYAPETWEGVHQYVQTRGFSDEEIFLAGLTVKRDRGVGYYDRFRNRIMFPIADHLGRIVGFGGRVLGEGEPKYLNTPQTSVYDKRSVLFGFFRAKQAIKSAGRAILVEGYTDVIASHHAGVANVVGSSGTALTREQIRLVKRLTPNIALAFDTDVAGQTAAIRGIEAAWEEEMNVLVIHLPEGKDPDELIRKDPDAWRTATERAEPFIAYVLNRAKALYDLSTVEGKKHAAKLVLPLLAKIRDGIEQTHYLQELAVMLNVPESVLRARLPSRSPVPATQKAPSPQKPSTSSRAQLLGERILGLAVRNQANLEHCIDHLEPAHLASTNLLGLYKAIVSFYTVEHNLDQHAFFKALGREDQELVALAKVIFLFGTSDLLPTDERLQRQELLDGLSALKRLSLQGELTRLQSELARAERSHARDRIDALTERVHAITKQLAESP